ncbi:c-type cytochrome [Rhodoferax sp. OV413]|uniref:c-type cytochrome n=1 Tax=Rhodoferax sp. OV413 TaxID=1855285 RepID=UPI0025D1E8FF|nr:c-type cytochrome [Rhodoferax sp. OV413]
MNKFLLSVSAALVASVTVFAAHAEGVKGDAQAGAKKNAMCIGCHGIVGYQASFPEVYKVPKISGQSGPYIAAALNAYKKGERKHPTMKGIALTLTEQDIADLSAFYEASGVVEGAPVLAKAAASSERMNALLAKGNCASCHGESLSKPIDPSYPKIAGQYSDYLYVALKSYKTEGNANIGRGNAIMGGIAKQYSNAELKELSNYIGSLPTDLKVVPQSRFK